MRVAIVTGGIRGIGRAVCERLKAEGYIVVANYLTNEEKARAFTHETGIPTYRWDVGDHEATQAACGCVEQEVGPIEVLVNNAGLTRDATLLKMTFEQWEQVITANLTGCFNMAKACFPGMRERGWGRIVNIGSINGLAGQFGQVNYSASKSGIVGFTKALAQEGARLGITVNTVAPGYVRTEMVDAIAPDVLAKIVARIPLGRLGGPEEVARAVAFLASDESGWITGSTLSINGGQYMH